MADGSAIMALRPVSGKILSNYGIPEQVFGDDLSSWMSLNFDNGSMEALRSQWFSDALS